MASTYEEFETTLEYEAYELKLSVRYRVVDYSPPQEFEAAEGECELTSIRVLGALFGPDALPVPQEALQAIERRINKDQEAFARLEKIVYQSIEL